MAKIDDVAGLIRAIGERDYAKAKRYGTVMVANERGAGREKAAIQLERSLQTWGAENSKLVELPQAIKSMIYNPDKLNDLSEIWLSGDVKNAVDGFVIERQKTSVIRDARLAVRNRILLAGPPGNGKTTLAGAISNELNLPFYVLNLAEIVSSYMGKTSGNIGKIFEYAFLNQCVLFLDELDAIGKSRASGTDGSIREYSLIVNTLLTSLDRLPDTAVVIGATNLPDLLDPAIIRRFNLRLWLDNPSATEIENYVTVYMDTHSICFNRDFKQLIGQPWSKIEEYCIEQHRNLIIGKSGIGTTGWIGKPSNQP
ncbi:ATP-dependent zinc metalloprotease FtsH [Sporomusa silvacetica DSM 10669]|uniref:ATP-dependent zinc metalloprotease FtsH n=1 Tax=Sporomusa silvacetica DSM 10669 TaxID=1123289 RepID=A0ABZ3II94_9FIRM|nr:AAA family ATPase [Sporomusa silvacetica]OZC21558.1 ATP-dependent zinc metalloprotease FtsH [Sporomusa silvacetica DSM 10669]